MYYDNESAEFYAEKRFDYRIPRNDSGSKSIRSEREQAALKPYLYRTPEQSSHARSTGSMQPPTLNTSMFNQYGSSSHTSRNSYMEVPPTPSYNDSPPQPFHSNYSYTSPLSAADQQYTQQQYDHSKRSQNQSYNTSNSYAHRYNKPNVKHGLKNTATEAAGTKFYTKTENSSLKRKADTPTAKIDANLPGDLKKLLQALFCELCNVKLNSPITAKIHYESKVHEKKVRNWLDEWSKRTGNPMPEIQSVSKDTPVGPNAFHCNSCDIPLTSQAHAQSHYLGKKHQMVIAGKSKPKGSGYYDEDGIWHKTPIPTDDNTPRFGIGTAFAGKNEAANTASNPAASILSIPDHQEAGQAASKPATSQADTSAAASPAKKVKLAPGDRPQFLCKLCDISTTSEQLLQMHYNGAKHARKLRTQFFAGTPDEAVAAMQAISTSGEKISDGGADSADGAVHANTEKIAAEMGGEPKFSAFRTPSGQFYCPTCDISVTSDMQLKQHLESKKHIRRVQEKKKVAPIQKTQ